MKKLSITRTFSFVFTNSFMKKWHKLGLTFNDRKDLKIQIIRYLIESPDNVYGNKLPGNRLQHTGGALKLRFSPKTTPKGRSGSERVIYFLTTKHRLIFIMVYNKKDQSTLTFRDDKIIHKLIKFINKKT